MARHPSDFTGIKLSNKKKIRYVGSSAAFAFDKKGYPPLDTMLRLKLPGMQPLLDPKLFTVVTKTLTRYPREGHYKRYMPWGCIRLLRDGVNIVGSVNAVGLTNPGIEWWCRKIGPKIDTSDMIVSIFSEQKNDSDYNEELKEMAGMLDRFELVAIEINASCPNTSGDCLKQNARRIVEGCKAAYRATRHPIILKVSPVHPIKEIIELLASEKDRIVEAFSINSVPWHEVFQDKKSPLEHFGGGGVSGKLAQPWTWDMVQKIVSLQTEAKIKIPVIGPSIWDYQDMDELLDKGAEALSM